MKKNFILKNWISILLLTVFFTTTIIGIIIGCWIMSIIGAVLSFVISLFSEYKIYALWRKHQELSYEHQTLEASFQVQRSESGEMLSGPIVDGGTF